MDKEQKKYAILDELSWISPPLNLNKEIDRLCFLRDRLIALSSDNNYELNQGKITL